MPTPNVVKKATHPLLVDKGGHGSGDRNTLRWWETGHGGRDTSGRHRDIVSAVYRAERRPVKVVRRCGMLTLAEAFLREPATEDLIELASIVLYYYFC